MLGNIIFVPAMCSRSPVKTSTYQAAFGWHQYPVLKFKSKSHSTLVKINGIDDKFVEGGRKEMIQKIIVSVKTSIKQNISSNNNNRLDNLTMQLRKYPLADVHSDLLPVFHQQEIPLYSRSKGE